MWTIVVRIKQMTMMRVAPIAGQHFANAAETVLS